MTSPSRLITAALLAICLLIAGIMAAGAAPRRQRTTRHGQLRVQTTGQTTEQTSGQPADSAMSALRTDTLRLAEAESAVVLRGYDKPLRAPRETLHITSRIARTITSLGLEITYLDTSGRMLHRRTADIPLSLPPGQTLKADIPTWDVNRSYYYRHGPRPRLSGVTPYDVACRVLTVICLADTAATSTATHPQQTAQPE